MISPLSLPEIFGKYRVVRLIGQGGMGSVWLARDTQLERHVALKVPHLNNASVPDPVVLARFRAEARAAAALHHPNICPVYEVGELGGIHYIALAFIEGRPLADFIRPGQPFPQSRAAVLVRTLALALTEAHRQGVVHRDLKPGNIHINQRDEPVIMDFGLASRMDEGAAVTRFGGLMGTPEYMAPEQIEASLSPVGPACDQYSLGVILYELLTGRVPLVEENVYALLYQVVNRSPRPLSVHRRDVSPALEAACLKALAKHPGNRHDSMAAFAAALEVCLRESSVSDNTPLLTEADSFQFGTQRPTVWASDLSVDCPACARRLKVPAVALGRRARCSACKTSFQVPSHLADPNQSPTLPLHLATPAAREVVNSLGMKLVRIPGGRFLMGSPPEEADRSSDEGPQHEVEITRPFYLGVYPVTQREYEQLTGDNPSYFTSVGDGQDRIRLLDTVRFPVEQVSWEDAAAFCRMLSDLPAERKRSRLYRLPTEAEWEYACRAGSAEAFHPGSSLSSLQANFNGNHPYGGALRGPFLERTTAVGSYPANAWGLHDMHGNVWEWCQDWYGLYPEVEGIRQDPTGTRTGTSRVLRGGSWNYTAKGCRSAVRNGLSPANRYRIVGFRVVLLADAE
jgi:eukaryotic-like serine/threonine-protein kinase